MGRPNLRDRFRYWIKPLVALDGKGNDVQFWVWQRKKIKRAEKTFYFNGF